MFTAHPILERYRLRVGTHACGAINLEKVQDFQWKGSELQKRVELIDKKRTRIDVREKHRVLSLLFRLARGRPKKSQEK
jgi:hypothetical protein